MTFTDNFDLNDYINDEQDVALVADHHLFENGPDLFNYAPGEPLAPDSSPAHQTFDFPQNNGLHTPGFSNTGLSTQGVNGDPYIDHTASFPPADPVNPELWNIDPGLVNTDTDFILTPTTVSRLELISNSIVASRLGFQRDALLSSSRNEHLGQNQSEPAKNIHEPRCRSGVPARFSSISTWWIVEHCTGSNSHQSPIAERTS